MVSQSSRGSTSISAPRAIGVSGALQSERDPVLGGLVSDSEFRSPELVRNLPGTLAAGQFAKEFQVSTGPEDAFLLRSGHLRFSDCGVVGIVAEWQPTAPNSREASRTLTAEAPGTWKRDEIVGTPRRDSKLPTVCSSRQGRISPKLLRQCRCSRATLRAALRAAELPQDIFEQRIRRHSVELCERYRICLAPAAARLADEQNFNCPK